MYEAFNPEREYIDIYKDDTSINWNQNYFENDIIQA